MVWDVSFTCDICGRKKSEATHWWMLILGDAQRFTLMPWDETESSNAEYYHLCGQGCAMQATERFMSHGSLLPVGHLQSAGEGN